MLEFAALLGVIVWLVVVQSNLNDLQRRFNALADQLLHQKDPALPRPTQPAKPAATPRPVAERAAPAGTALHKEAPPPSRPEHSTPPPSRAAGASVPLSPKPASSIDASAWLAENGLAWLGGGGLALGGIFLVVYAAQRGFFTPQMRIWAALGAGALMLAASEWIRRQTRVMGGRHQLASAATAGAGAATLYGAILAAYTLYKMLPFPAAAALLGVGSLALLAYALIQGEAIALLAIGGAFAAPALTGVNDWNTLALDSYFGLLLVTGFGMTAERRWSIAGYVTLAGATFWALPALWKGRADVALLMGGAVACAVAVSEFTHWRESRAATRPSKGIRALPAVALVVASLLLALAWAFSNLTDRPFVIAASLAASLLALAAFAIGRGRLHGGFYIAPVFAALLGALGSSFVFRGAAAQPVLVAAYGLAALTAAGGLAAGLASNAARRLVVGVGALGAALLATLIWPALDGSGMRLDWAPPALLSVGMAAGAVLLARSSGDVRRDPALGLWIAGAAELAFVAVHAASPLGWAFVGHAAMGLGFAGLALRLRWRGLAEAAVAGGLVGLAALLRPAHLDAVVSGKIALPQTALVVALASGLAFAAGRVLRLAPPDPERKPQRTEAEALDTAALMILLGGLFLMLSRWSGEAKALGQLVEAPIRTVLILVTGLLLAVRARPDAGFLARWRLPVIVAIGVTHAIIFQVMWNPWFNSGPQPIGLPVLNTLMLSALAPGLLLIAIAYFRMGDMVRGTRASALGGFLFVVFWALMAVRQAFHPAGMDSTHPILRAELCGYAVIVLAAARAVLWLRARALTRPQSSTGWLALCAAPAMWLALAWSATALWFLSPPWWGFDTSAFKSYANAGVYFAAFALATGLTVALYRPVCRQGETQGWRVLATAVLSAFVFDIFVLITLAIRLAYRGLAMGHQMTEARLETWTYSAAWAVFGLAVLTTGAAWRNLALRWLGLGLLFLTIAKVLMFDMAALDGVVRAASFLAVGALLLVGALMARRLNARALLLPRKDSEAAG